MIVDPETTMVMAALAAGVSVVRHPAGASTPRFPKPVWWRWPNAAPRPSSTP